MTVPQNTAYPAALTNKEWQKKKSFLDKAKSKTKTGLGVALIAASNAWNLINFNTLDATKQAITTPQVADQVKQAADNHLKGPVKIASNLLKAASQKAATTKVNAALSPKARQAAGLIETGLNNQRKLLKAITLTDFDTAKTNIIQLVYQTNLSTIKNRLVAADKFIKEVKATPTRKTFNAGIQEACRRLTVPLGTIGASATKPDPRPLIKPIEEWADGKEQLGEMGSPAMERKVVIETIKFYEKAINAIKQWAA